MLMWRSTHDALMAEKEKAHAETRAAYRQTLKVLLRLKATGAVLPPKASTNTPDAIDPLDVVIEDKAEGNPALMRHFRKQVARLRARGLSDDDIREAIATGEEPE